MDSAFFKLLSFAIGSILLFFPMSGWAQEKQVQVRTNESAPSIVQLKWFVQSIYNLTGEGFNIYRQEEGTNDWRKLNNTPFKGWEPIAEAAKASDKDLEPMETLMNETKGTDAEGFVKITILIKAIRSNEFAKFLGIYYEDASTISGKSYAYKIMEIQNGKEREIGKSEILTAGTPTIIKPLQNIETIVTEGKVAFHWLFENDVHAGVNIYRWGNSSSDKILLNENPIIPSRSEKENGEFGYQEYFYQDQAAIEGQSYTYELEAIDFFGVPGERSKEFKVILKDETLPIAPANLIPYRNDRKVLLKWIPSISEDVEGYNVYRAISSEGPFEKVNTSLVKDSVFQDEVVVYGPYYYSMSSVDFSGNESERTFHSYVPVVDQIPPIQPVKLTATAEPGLVKLSWEPNPESDIEGYLVFRSIEESKNKNFARLNPDPIKEPYFEDDLSKEPKNKFLYHIIAIDTSSNLSEASEWVSIQLPDVTPPKHPTITNIKVGKDSVQLFWRPSFTEDVFGYTVFRCTNQDTLNWKSIHKNLLDKESITFLDTNIPTDQKLSYRVQAEDDVGNKSSYSNTFTIQTPKGISRPVPTAKITVTYNQRKNRNTIKWRKTEAANYKGNILFRKAASGALVPITKMLNQETEYQDDNILDGQEYTYQLRTYFTNGKIAKSSFATVELEN